MGEGFLGRQNNECKKYTNRKLFELSEFSLSVKSTLKICENGKMYYLI